MQDKRRAADCSPMQVTPVGETVKRLLAAAARHIADAKVQVISAETRFSSAYTAIRMLAAALDNLQSERQRCIFRPL